MSVGDRTTRERLTLDVTREQLALGLVLLVGATVRLYGLGGESIWFDESVSANFAINWTYGEILFDVPTQDPHPPLYYLILKAWTNLAGTTEVGLRSLSVLADIGSILLVYGIATRLFDRRVGLLGSLLFALSPFYVWYAREARMYALATLFALASYYQLLAIVQRDEGFVRNGWGYVLTTVALCYTHAFGVLIVVAQNVALADGLLNRNYVGGLVPTRWVRLQAIVGVAIFPYYLELILQTIGGQLGGFVEWIPEPSLATPWLILGSYVGRTVPPASPESRYSLWTFPDPLGDLSILGELVTLAALAFVAYAIVEYLRRPETETDSVSPEPFLFAWFAVPFVSLFAISFVISPVVFDRYTAPFTVALLILLARGLTLLTDADGRPALPIDPSRGTLAIAAVVILVLGVPLAGIHGETQKQQWREAVQTTESNADSEDVVLVSPFWSTQPYEYYATRDIRVTGVSANAIPSGLAGDTRGAQVVWLVTAFTTDTDYDRLVASMEDLGYDVDRREQLTDIAVYRLVRDG